MKRKNKEKVKRFASQGTGGWTGIRPVVFNESKFDAKRERRKGKEICKNGND